MNRRNLITNICFALAILLCFAILASAQDRTPVQKTGIGWQPYAVLAAGQVADSVTTLHGWQRGDIEQNGLIGNNAARLMLMKSVGAVTVAVLMRTLTARGGAKGRKAAAVLGYLAGGTGVALAIHNARVR